MNSCDWSEISDKTAHSQASCSGSSRLIRSTLDYFNNTQNSQKCPLRSAHPDMTQTEKPVKALALCDESIAEYIRSTFLFHCTKEVSLNSNTLSDAVKKNLKELIMIHEIRKYMYLPPPVKDSHEELTILGITDLPKYKFSYAEKLDIKCSVETLLSEKIHKFLLTFSENPDIATDAIKINKLEDRQKLLERNDLQLIEWKERIEDQLIMFENDILKCRQLLNTWRELKYCNANETYYRKAGYLLLQGQVAEVQAKITKLSCLFRMFKETPTTIDAFKRLNMLMDEKLSAVLIEKKHKEHLKKSYECVKGPEYEKVLKNYLDLSRAVERKRHILDQL